MRISDWSSYVCSSDLHPTESTRSRIGVDRMRLRAVGLVHPVALFVQALELCPRQAFMQDLLELVQPGDPYAVGQVARSAGRRVGKEGVSTCRSRWSPVP